MHRSVGIFGRFFILASAALLLITQGCAHRTNQASPPGASAPPAARPAVRPDAPPPPPPDQPVMTGVHYEYDQPPVLVDMVKPVWPESLKTSGIEGKAVLTLIVDEKGDVVWADVILSTPVAAFGIAAREALMQWKWKPALLGGEPVKVMIGQNVEFTLRQRSQPPPAPPPARNTTTAPPPPPPPEADRRERSTITLHYEGEPEFVDWDGALGFSMIVLSEHRSPHPTLLRVLDSEGRVHLVRPIRVIPPGR